jgi:IS30 family transposase
MRGYHHLTQRNRYLIEDLLSLGKSKATIAREIGVSRSTISREVKRNSNQKGGYKARGAHQVSLYKQTNYVDCSRKIEGLLEHAIVEKLQDRWSPAQISGRLKKEGRWSVSHQTIYNWIYRLCPDAKEALRIRGRRKRRKRKYSRPFPGKDKRKNIELRPWEADERVEIGHWERDLVEGRRGHSALLVLVDRKSRYTLIKKTNNKLSDTVANLTKQALVNQVCKTMTNDNGVEFGYPLKQEAALGKPVFYTDAYSSWQRGTVENTNGLLRQYFPKGCNFDEEPEEDLRFVENQLNDRPRRGLSFKTAREEHFGLNQKLFDSNYAIRKRMNERSDESLKQFLLMTGVALDP